MLLVSAAGGNIPTRSLLDDRHFQTTVLVTEYYDAKMPLPPHDVVFNSIGDADLCRDGLEAARAVLARTGRPVINHPARVLKTGRVANVERLRGLPNVIVPRMTRLPRRVLAGPEGAEASPATGFAFPLLVRAPGFHTGHHFVRVETPEELAAAVADFPGDDVWLIEQLDARDGEGMFRKFRVMFVDGNSIRCILRSRRTGRSIISPPTWRNPPANRAQRRRLPRRHGERHRPTRHGRRSSASTRRSSLDYGGIDFAVNGEGDILFFEANATMVVLPLAADDKWAYRRPAFENVFAAVRTMLTERSVADSAA